jgi:uncharacterized protein with FMN-binding domain
VTGTHAATTHTYKGPVVDMRWGPVQAAIKVKNHKISSVGIAVAPDTDRSQFIDDQATPLLKEEVLRAQSAKIELISGATMTSEAFVESLKKAIKKAKAAHTLP